MIEEGLGGRLTATEDYQKGGPKYKPPRNGFEYFQACSGSHAPFDVLVLMLGTNDVKKHYNILPNNLADDLGKYASFVRGVMPNCKIILVCPPPIKLVPPLIDYDEESLLKSKQLSAHLEKIALDNNYDFLNAGDFIKVGKDGVHLSKECHFILGKTIANIIKP